MAAPWSKDDIKLLADLYPRGGPDVCLARFPNRTRHAIFRAAQRLHISMPFGELTECSLSATEAAYFAGHFDGEGCIQIGNKRKFPNVQIVVVNCCLPVLERYKDMFGGAIYQRVKRGNHKKNIFAWQMSRIANVRAFIKAVLPYSVEKREQLNVAANFLRLRSSLGTRNSVPATIRRDASELESQLRLLKRQEYSLPQKP